MKDNNNMTNTEKTLTDYQKDYFDFIIKQHKSIKKTEPTILQLNKLMDYIIKDYQINFNMISHITGKVLTGDKKHSQMVREDMGRLENILDW
jgi:hypothetical protein